MAKIILIFLTCIAQSAYALQGNFAANFSINSTFFPTEKTGQFTSNSTKVANGEFGVGFDNKLFSVEGGFSYDVRDNLAIGVNAALIKSKANSTFFTAVMQVSGQMFDNVTNFAYAAAEGMFKLENYGPVVPVLGVGAGITSLSFASYNSLGFLYQMISGVEIALTDSFYLNVTYRYNHIKSVDFNVTSVEYIDSGTIQMEVIEGDFLVEAIPMHSVGMGIKFIF